MQMSQEAKKYIQEVAWDRFPAQELWIRSDNTFWAFDINDNEITFTDGTYQDNNIVFYTTIFPTNNGEEIIDSFISDKRSDGYECFAIQFRK